MGSDAATRLGLDTVRRGIRLATLHERVLDLDRRGLDLDLGRAGIGDRPLELFDDLRFLRDLQSHVFSLPKSADLLPSRK